MKGLFERHGSIAVPGCALALVVYGCFLLGGPHLYRARGFSVAFDLASPKAWGIFFIASGVLALVRVSIASTFFVLASLLAWSACLFLAVVEGKAEGSTGWLWPMTLAVIASFSVSRHGIKR